MSIRAAKLIGTITVDGVLYPLAADVGRTEGAVQRYLDGLTADDVEHYKAFIADEDWEEFDPHYDPRRGDEIREEADVIARTVWAQGVNVPAGARVNVDIAVVDDQ